MLITLSWTGSSDHYKFYRWAGSRMGITMLQGHQIANRSLVRSADHDSQDKNLVGSLDRFAKTAGSHDSVDSILIHVYPYFCQLQDADTK